MKKIRLTEGQNIPRYDDLKKSNLVKKFSDDYIMKVFLDSLNNWNKKNLKNLTENIYQEIIKESLKNKLK